MHKEAEGINALYSKREWDEWLREYGYNILGDAFYEWAPNIGEVISFRCHSHLIGLKMAFEKIGEKVIAEIKGE